MNVPKNIARFIKENNLDIVVVLLSAYQDFEFAREAISANVYGYLLKPVRFEKFVTLVEGIRKSISRLKDEAVPSFGIKSVHVMWLYRLLSHEEGLTAAELAVATTVDRSLVSREISALKKNGYIESHDSGSKRGYKARWCLTERGRAAANGIRELAIRIQEKASEGIDPEELASFYKTFEKIHANFLRLAASEDI